MTSVFLGLASALAGRPEETIGMLDEYDSSNLTSFSLGILGFAYAAASQREQALVIADELAERKTDQYVSPLFLAWIHGALGENDESFRWLQRAFEERTPILATLKFTRSIFPPQPPHRPTVR